MACACASQSCPTPPPGALNAVFAFSLARLLANHTWVSRALPSAATGVSSGGVVTKESRLECRVWACAEEDAGVSRLLCSSFYPWRLQATSQKRGLTSKESGLPDVDVGEPHQDGLPLPLLVLKALCA